MNLRTLTATQRTGCQSCFVFSFKLLIILIIIIFSPSRHFGTETLFCDCQLRWLLLWARSISVRIGNDTACVYPAHLHGLEFRNLHEQQLTCVEDLSARATGALCLLLLIVQGYWLLSVKAELRSGCILGVSLFSLNACQRKFWSTCWCCLQVDEKSSRIS